MVPLFSRRRGTPLHYSLKLIRANKNGCTVMQCNSKINCSKQFFRHVIILAPIALPVPNSALMHFPLTCLWQKGTLAPPHKAHEFSSPCPQPTSFKADTHLRSHLVPICLAWLPLQSLAVREKKKTFFLSVQSLGGEKLLDFVEKCR